MPKVTKECKVCGKKYTACCTADWGVFHWRDVACSLECAEEYFARIEESRGNGKNTSNAVDN